MDKIHQKISATHIAPEWESKPNETSPLAPRRESGFAYGRSEASPDSEQIEHVIAEQFMRNSVSVEQIQDGLGRGGQDERCRLTRGADKPSRGTSGARGEQESAETSSFRCDCERCHLSRGAVNNQRRGGKAAFTLAEVLITLGIIGVVAAITLPSLIQNYQKKALATQTQKFYSMMSQAVKQYMADYGVDDLRNTPLASDNYEDSESPEAMASIRDFATKYLKVVRECEDIEIDDGIHDSSCFAPVYRRWDNSIYEYHPMEFDYVLADGSTISIFYYGNKETPGPIDLYVDVNGKKGPNRFGYDYWAMSIFYDGVIDEGTVTPECRKEGDCIDYGDTPSEIREYKFENTCKSGHYGGCFGHLLENGFKFDY